MPLLALFGVVTGLSGLVVIDLDIKGGEDGPGNWARLVEGRDVPATFWVRTPSGGEHLWFRDPDWRYRSSAGRVAPGVDVPAVGGYVIAPSPGSGYSWINAAPL
ncbi:MAG: bifunctional DNA primase/polymerase [Actinomycetia bacterium]|nr:bifunctional DNA primase/polymerase [Actinomycetes bacterium]